MIFTLPLGPAATFVSEHPWPTVALVFLAVVIAPAIWSHRRDRQRAAMAVIRVILEAVTAIAAAADSPFPWHIAEFVTAARRLLPTRV